MKASSESWPEVVADRPHHRSFSQHGWVVEESGEKAVFIGGQLIGVFGPKDTVARNLLLVTASRDPRVHLGRLAKAFGVGKELSRRVRRRHEEGGVESLLQVGRPGRKTVCTKKVTDALMKMFDQGASINQALAQYQGGSKGKGSKGKGSQPFSRATVGRVYQQWKQRRREQSAVCACTPTQLTLPVQQKPERQSTECAPHTAVGSEPMKTAGRLHREQAEALGHERPSIQAEETAIGSVVVAEIPAKVQAAESEELRQAPQDTTTAETAGQQGVCDQTDSAESQNTLTGGVNSTAHTAVADDTEAAAADLSDEHLVLGEPRGELDWGQMATGNGEPVQHAGTWVMLAMLHAWGLYRHLEHLRAAMGRQGKQLVGAAVLRLAVDMTVMSLCIGESCIEGVRRIATLSAPILLRSHRVPSAPWVRHILHLFAQDNNAGKLHFLTANRLIRRAVASAKLKCAQGGRVRIVFYVDNHMRPYTGKHKLRKGWRVQDKRARPGVTDYWVHDEDGRAILRMTSPSHEPLTNVLAQVANLLRTVVGRDGRIVLVFDRAGAFPNMLQELRDTKYDFATYERRPYAELSPSEFVHELTRNKETIRYVEKHDKNLRKGRGRVRRISLLMPDHEQVNILCISQAPAQEIIDIMLSRWGRQENQLKHQVERWGINQLDGRRVAPYPPDAIIPNPERTRLERALRVVQADEADALRKLSRLPRNHPDCEQLKARIREARAREKEFLAQRPSIPKKAPVRDTSLSDTLVAHQVPYKLLIDTLRVLLANLESDLAVKLGLHLSRPAEAKKTLSNLLKAPGRVRINARSIRVELMPSGTPSEQQAFQAFLSDLNRYHLTLPGDQSGRRLVFQTLSE